MFSLSGVWCLVSGVWCLVSGVWCLVFGFRCLVFGFRCLVFGVRGSGFELLSLIRALLCFQYRIYSDNGLIRSELQQRLPIVSLPSTFLPLFGLCFLGRLYSKK